MRSPLSINRTQRGVCLCEIGNRHFFFYCLYTPDSQTTVREQLSVSQALHQLTSRWFEHTEMSKMLEFSSALYSVCSTFCSHYYITVTATILQALLLDILLPVLHTLYEWNAFPVILTTTDVTVFLPRPSKLHMNTCREQQQCKVAKRCFVFNFKIATFYIKQV